MPAHRLIAQIRRSAPRRRLAIEAAIRPQPAFRRRPPTISRWTRRLPLRHRYRDCPSRRAKPAAEASAHAHRQTCSKRQSRAAATPRRRPRPRPGTAPAGRTGEAVAPFLPADRPVADKLRDLLAGQGLRYFDRKSERAAVEKFYSRALCAALVDKGGVSAARQGRDRAAEGRRLDGLDPAIIRCRILPPRRRRKRWPTPS